MSFKKISWLQPFIPEGKSVFIVSEDDKFMAEAKRVAKKFSLDPDHRTGAVIVSLEGEILGSGANGTDFHEKNGCERKRQNIPTGQGYELCEGCSPTNHAEQKALANVLQNGRTSQGANLYLWGHFWCCEGCWEAMIEAGIRDVFLLEGADTLFKK